MNVQTPITANAHGITGTEFEAFIATRPEGDFRAKADVVVSDDPVPAVNRLDRVYLPAEVISHSNTAYEIDLKCERYAQHPDTRHILLIHQDALRAEHRARAAAWAPVMLEGAAARLVLPDLGVDVALGELYRGAMPEGGA